MLHYRCMEHGLVEYGLMSAQIQCIATILSCCCLCVWQRFTRNYESVTCRVIKPPQKLYRE